MKSFISFVFLAALTGCGVNNTTFNQPFAPPSAELTSNTEAQTAAPLPEQAQPLKVSRVVAVKDADRILVDVADLPAVFGQALQVTLNDAWYPQIRSARCAAETVLASQAATELQTWLQQAEQITLTDLTRDSEFGVFAKVWLDGALLSERMIKRGLAKPLNESGRWCY